MQKTGYYLFTILLSLVAFASCDTEEEPIMTEEGTFTMSVKDGYILKEGNKNILSLTVSYPMLNVSSIFSLTAKAPEIAYVGQYSVIEQIPMVADEQFSTRAVIHDGGGYLIKTTLIKSGTSETVDCVIKMLVRERQKNEDGEPASLEVRYQFYRLSK